MCRTLSPSFPHPMGARGWGRMLAWPPGRCSAEAGYHRESHESIPGCHQPYLTVGMTLALALAVGELSGAVPSRQGPVPGAVCVW